MKDTELGIVVFGVNHTVVEMHTHTYLKVLCLPKVKSKCHF